jgi:glycosyltransferase involved in cell wall biosynthesis
MRILLVSHDFLPNHPAGTEIYTHQLGLELKARGHDVHVFTTDKDISRENLQVTLREWEGLPVHELTNNLFYNEFRETWDYPPAARTFALFLKDLRPDIVHFMHLLYLSVGCAEEAHRLGIPVFQTLHDYWLQCARFGQRVHADGSICHTIDFARCGDCLAHFKYKQSRLERRTSKIIAAVRSSSGLDLGPLARGLATGIKRRMGRTAGRGRTDPPSGGADAPADASALGVTSAIGYEPADPVQREFMRDEAAGRDRAIRERLLPVVRRFIAPSRFLMQRFRDWGVPEQQMLHMRTGIDLRPFANFRREPSLRTRIAFIGTLAPHKGPHVLLQAWKRLPPALRERADLVLWGPKAHNPSYVRQLEQLALDGGAVLAGGLKRHEVVRALARVDLLVMPSVWYENSPLIILEALATRTPLAVSDLGGMAELVEEGVTGYHFRVGDSASLAGLLARILEQPAELSRLISTAPNVRDVSEDARDLELLYENALAERSSS